MQNVEFVLNMSDDVSEIQGLLLKLRNLLSTALPDELLEDDISSLASSQEEDSSPQRGLLPPTNNNPNARGSVNLVAEQWQQAGQPQLAYSQQQTSTPLEAGGSAPSLKTPATLHHQHGQHPTANYAHHFQQLPPTTVNGWDQNGLPLEPLNYARGEVEGSAGDEYPAAAAAATTAAWMGPGGPPLLSQGGQAYGVGTGDRELYLGQGQVAAGHQGRDQYMQLYPGYHGYQQQQQPPLQSDLQRPQAVAPLVPLSPLQPNGGAALDNYQVTYGGGGSDSAGGQPVSGGDKENQADDHGQQREFLSATGGPGGDRQLAQLQILYKARGRKLEELTNQLEILKEDSGREKRMVNHKLAVSEGERRGVTDSLDQAQKLLVDSKQENANLQADINAKESQIQSLSSAKVELVKKLQASESTVKSLSVELAEVTKSESLTRAREQHQAIVLSLQTKHQQELLSLQETHDQVHHQLQQKNEEISNLKVELSSVRREFEGGRLEQGELVNRLTRSLEDSQHQCRQLLQTGTMQEVGQLQMQLHQANSAKNITENLNRSMQEEMRDLREQLVLYESASRLGVYPASSATVDDLQSESFAQLGIKPQTSHKDGSKSSISSSPMDRLSPEDTVYELRSELERSLNSIKTKRQQVSGLQDQLKGAKAELEAAKFRAEKSQKLVQEQQVKLQALEKEVEDLRPGGITLNEEKLKRDLARLQTNIGIISEENQDLKRRLQEVSANEEKLNEINSDLRQQMSQMVTEFDEDKRSSLETCEKTCLQLHEDVKAKIRQERDSEFQLLQKNHDDIVQQMKQQLNEVNREADKIREMYVQISKEKGQLEENLVRRHQEELKRNIDEVTKAKQAELQKMEELMKQMSLGGKERKKTKEEEEDTERKVASALWTARIEWTKDQEIHIAERVDMAVANARKQWAEEQSAEEVRSGQQLKQVVENLQQEIERLKGEAAEEAAQASQVQGQAEWKNQREELLRQKEKENKEALKRVQEKYNADYDHLLEQHKAMLQSTRDMYEKDKVSLMEQKEKEIEVLLADKEMEWMDKYRACIQAQKENISKTIDMHKQEYIKDKEELILEHKRELENFKRQLVQENKRASYESEKQKIEERLISDDEMRKKEEQWASNRKELSTTIKRLKDDLEESETRYKGEIEQLTESLKGELETVLVAQEQEIDLLKEKLRKSKNEVAEANKKVEKSMEYLHSQLDGEYTATVEALQTEINRLQQRIRELEGQQMGMGATSKKPSSQSSDALQELRNHYLETVNKIRADVLNYISETHKNCRQAIRNEVEKERNAVAMQMRKYYLQCFHKLLEEDSVNGLDSDHLMSTAHKLAVMAKALELSPSKCNFSTDELNNTGIVQMSEGAKGTISSVDTHPSPSNAKGEGESKRDYGQGQEGLHHVRNLSRELSDMTNRSTGLKGKPTKAARAKLTGHQPNQPLVARGNGHDWDPIGQQQPVQVGADQQPRAGVWGSSDDQPPPLVASQQRLAAGIEFSTPNRYQSHSSPSSINSCREAGSANNLSAASLTNNLSAASLTGSDEEELAQPRARDNGVGEGGSRLELLPSVPVYITERPKAKKFSMPRTNPKMSMTKGGGGGGAALPDPPLPLSQERQRSHPEKLTQQSRIYTASSKSPLRVSASSGKVPPAGLGNSCTALNPHHLAARSKLVGPSLLSPNLSLVSLETEYNELPAGYAATTARKHYSGNNRRQLAEQTEVSRGSSHDSGFDSSGHYHHHHQRRGDKQ